VDVQRWQVVVLVHLTATGNGRDGDWLRVTRRGFYVGEARDWDGVARLGVDIGDLRQVLGLGICLAGSRGGMPN
jgi:hypothetical protein